MKMQTKYDIYSIYNFLRLEDLQAYKIHQSKIQTSLNPGCSVGLINRRELSLYFWQSYHCQNIQITTQQFQALVPVCVVFNAQFKRLNIDYNIWIELVLELVNLSCHKKIFEYWPHMYFYLSLT